MSPAALLELRDKTEELIPLAAARDLVDGIYALDVSDWTDEDFAQLEQLIDRLIHLIDALPTAQHRPLIERLWTAREGVEQGMAPDPTKRPTLDEMRRFVSAHL